MDTHQPVTKHYIWVDYAKFLSIFLVVFFHTPPALSGLLGESLLLLRIPSFFFLAGLLFRIDKYPSFYRYLIHRSKQLLVPYFYFFLLFYSYWLLIGKATGTPEDINAPYYQPILEFLYGVPKLVCMPMWFIPCLFITQCIFYLVFKRMKRFVATILLLLFPFIPLLVNLDNAPFSLGSACHGITFYGIASLYRKEVFQWIEKGNNFFIGILCLIINSILSYFIPNIPPTFELILVKLLGSFTILPPVFILIKWLSDFSGKNLFVEKMASNAIIILAFHTYSIIIIHRVIMWSLHETPDYFEGKYLLKFLIALLSTISMIIPIWIINKYFPFIIGKSKDSKLPNNTEIRS